MKKILYLVSTLSRSGPTNQLSYFIKYLDRLKFEPMVLTLSPEEKDSLIKHFTDDLSIPVHSLQLSRTKGLFKARSAVKEFIAKNRIDLVHSQGIRADAINSSLDIPNVATLRNNPYFDYSMSYGKLTGTLIAKRHLTILRKINRAFACSQSTAHSLKEKRNYSIDYIQNGTDQARFHSLDKKTSRITLGLPIDKRIFISVGNLTALKDPMTIIKAFKEVNLEESILIFLGNGNLKETCIDLAENDERILFFGKVSNVADFLSASDFFISASLAEGLPNSVMEAMAAGVPCLLSNIPPHEEIRNLNTNSSFLFPTKSSRQLAQLMQTIINSNYEQMSSSCTSIIQNHLNAKIMSEKYQMVYSELLEN